MKIRTVQAIPFVLPYRRPFHMASGVVSEAAHVLIRIETDDGSIGSAEAVSRSMIYGESQASIVEAVKAWFSPGLIGLDPFETESAQAVLRAVVGNETAKGAIDIALHDLRGKLAGMPTWRLLGAAAPSLRITRMLGMGTPSEVVAEALEAKHDYGIGSFKVKVDADMEAALTLLSSLRRELGDGALLYLDANQSLMAEAVIAARSQLTDLAIEFLEEPIPATDVVGRARIAAAVPIPLMSDESARTVETAAVQLTTGSARALSIKTARTGFTESARILGLARGLHCRTVIGSQGDSAIGALSSVSFGAAFESTANEPAELDYFLGLGDQLVAEMPTLENGRILIDPHAIGNGVVIDEDKLTHYRVDV